MLKRQKTLLLTGGKLLTKISPERRETFHHRFSVLRNHKVMDHELDKEMEMDEFTTIYAFEFGGSIEEAKKFLEDEATPRYEHILDDDDADNGQYRYRLATIPLEVCLKKIQPFLSLLKEVICDQDEQRYRYLLHWLALCVQRSNMKKTLPSSPPLLFINPDLQELGLIFKTMGGLFASNTPPWMVIKTDHPFQELSGYPVIVISTIQGALYFEADIPGSVGLFQPTTTLEKGVLESAKKELSYHDVRMTLLSYLVLHVDVSEFDFVGKLPIGFTKSMWRDQVNSMEEVESLFYHFFNLSESDSLLSLKKEDLEHFLSILFPLDDNFDRFNSLKEIERAFWDHTTKKRH